MQINISSDSFFIFDLDDTLFPEMDFLESGFRHIATVLEPVAGTGIYREMIRRYHNRENVFQWIVDTYSPVTPGIGTAGLLALYREHFPDISLPEATARFLQELQELSVPAALISDGRSITQRNKLKALGIDCYFTDIIISEEFGSEKPDERNYLYFEEKYPGREFYFFGDNTSKDFIVPDRLGWRKICLLDTGRHIHKQSFGKNTLPDYFITSFADINLAVISC